MSRYRKTMRQAIEEGLSNMQIAILKKEYAPFKGKTISAARAKQLMNILDKFKEADLKKLGKETIPFVSSGARSKLAVRNMKFKVTTINPFKEEVTQEDFDLEEGKMKTIATMFAQGKSAEEIAKKMGLSVDTVKTILGEVKENLDEAPDPTQYGPDKVAKAMAIAVKSDGNYSQAVREIEKIGRGLSKVSTIARALKTANEQLEEKIQPFMISYSKYGKHAGFEDAKSLQDLQNKAQKLRSKGFTIDKMGRYNPPVKEDKDAFDPITEACWVGYKKVGMKKKGDRMVPNCVPEEFKVEEYITEQDDSVTMAKDMKKKKEELPKKDDVATDADTEKKEGSDDKEKLKAEIDKKDAEIQSLKVKAETEKAKVAKKETEKMVNPETGEPLLQVGIAYKLMRDKMKKEKIKEDADYLKPRLNPTQIANIKKTWQNKKPGDVTPAVKKMIKDMDIPTQLAIKHAKINQLSKLVEDLGKEDEPKVKKIITKLKGASQAHAGQAKDLEKAMKTEAFAVQITKKDGGKLIHGKYKDKAAADKFVKWYKTGDMKDTKSIEVVKEMAKDKAYAIGMATAKKKYNDEPPLDKKTIKKAHEIGDKLSKMKKENKDHPAREVYEQIKGLKNKAEKSGMPYGILKKVYDRGMAAWRGGHRPGTTQQQWAFARVNSFVTKSSGTWGGADKDLAAKVKGN